MLVTADVPPGTVFQYENAHGSHIIAAFSDTGEWKVLCINANKHVHTFTWTHEQMLFDYNLGK